MARPPTVDGRTAADVFDEVTDRAPHYVEEWTPEADEFGTTLAHLFSEMARDVVTRLDATPEKFRTEFYETVGFERDPPASARAPLSVTLVDGAEGNVSLPAGTQAVATGTDESERVFEVGPGDGFEATPAALRRVVSVDPEFDRIFDHGGLLDSGDPVTLFSGTDSQRHALYVGHDDLLTVSPGGRVRLELATEASTGRLSDVLSFEYYGVGAGDDGEERWRPARLRDVDVDHRGTAAVRFAVVTLELPGKTTETAVGGVESRWLRCRLNPNLRAADQFDLTFGAVSLVAGMVSEEDDPLTPDEVRNSDAPLSLDDGPIYPLGKRPRTYGWFAVSNEEAFTKPGATVELTLTPTADSGTAGETELSWEYWREDNWAALSVGGGPDGDGPASLPGTVVFDVPDDITPTAVGGVDGYWIRALVDGDEFQEVDFRRAPDTTTDDPTDETWTVVPDHPPPPRVSSVELRYERRERAVHLCAENNGAVGPDLGPVRPDRFSPFAGLPDDSQTLYLGFDGPLEDGPIPVFVSPTDREFPRDFHPRVRWEARLEGSDGRWERLDARDDTESMTARGAVALSFPATTASSSLFGAGHHWIRGRVAGQAFVPSDAELPLDGPSAAAVPVRIVHVDAPRERLVLENVGRRSVDLSGYLVDFEYRGHVEQVRALPVGTTIPPGGRLAIGSGAFTTGSVDVSFDFTEPVLNNYDPDRVAVRTPGGAEVTTRRDRLGDESPEGTGPTEAETDREAGNESRVCDVTVLSDSPTGRPTRRPPTLVGLYPNTQWVVDRHSVEDETLGSSDGTTDQTFDVSEPPATAERLWVDESETLGPDARRHLLETGPADVDVTGGSDDDPERVWVRWERVPDFAASGPDDRHYTFDGVDGTVTFGGRRSAVPPRGDENLRMSYQSGGGSAGNVPAGAIATLRQGHPFVDSVSNPEAAAGGTDAEATASVLRRAPAELRDRGRAVAAADYERIARASSRAVARAKCVPGMDETGADALGWVTVLVVPQTTRAMPAPSPQLRRQVERGLRARAPVTLVESGRLVVRGPSFVEVAASTTLVAVPGTSFTSLEERAERAIGDYLHPLTGSQSGDGWRFGAVPCPSDLYALLEGVDGVDHVRDLSLTFTGSGDPVTVTDDARLPNVEADALVYGGAHDVVARGDD